MAHFPIGSRVRFNAGGRALLRKLMQHGGGHAFTDSKEHFTADEVDGAFIVLVDDDQREVRVRSEATGREGWIYFGSLRLERPGGR